MTLALLLIHEFQHVKLGAVLDLFDLFDPADKRLYHAPWRAAMRPLEGLLQGTYAHLAVSRYWRTRQQATAGAEAEAAGKRFRLWDRHTKQAIETLARPARSRIWVCGLWRKCAVWFTASRVSAAPRLMAGPLIVFLN